MAYSRRKFVEVIKISAVKSTVKGQEDQKQVRLLYKIEENARKGKWITEKCK
jgi:hypothetical protein